MNMSPALHVLLFASSIATVSLLATHKADNRPGCQEFSKDSTFTDNQAVGDWHLLHHGTEKSGSEDSSCVQFTTVTDQEQKDLSNRIGKFVHNVKWENLTLKMQIPCSSMKSNQTRDYYLEKLEGYGSYRTLPISPSGINPTEMNLYQTRLKIVEGQYLGMMDCYGKVMFLMGKEPPKGKELDAPLRKMIEAYWPKER